ncbi:MAG: oligopeptide transporter, OPT family [Thermoanaerobaculia bacterium]
MSEAHEKKFEPYVPDVSVIPEFTFRAILLGSIFGILFGAATVYLALRAGLTVSASVPIAVLSIAVFKKFGKSTILENNMVQTIGSAGESVAAGVVFTVPAMLFLSGGTDYFTYATIFVLAAVGGTLGVLFMVPLRRALIVNEHGKLPYPEGTACADVLIAGERGGNLAKMVFAGVGVSLLYKFLYGILGLWNESATWFRTGKDGVIPDATLSCDVTPEYLGLGYIIGPKIAGELCAGGLLAWLALIPLISMFVPETRLVDDLTKLGFSDAWRAGHSHAEWIYRAYIRYIGAGAVACAGLITLIKTLPTIASAFSQSVKSFRGEGAGAAKKSRTDDDLGMGFVLLGSLALVLIIAFMPNFPNGTFPGNLLMGALVILFGFFFVTVSSRIVGIIGTSSNPISGMTIATLMAVCVIFVITGRTGDVQQPIALCVGALVCIAAANAGATSQDLKTGYIVGATPRKQQLGFIIGVLVSTLAIGGTLFLLDKTYAGGELHGIGGPQLPAPQATLMATIIKGLLAQNLPWAPVLIGAAMALMAQMMGAHALSWAVGAYLPLSTTFPIWIGGMVKAISDRLSKRKEESELSSGMLYATGLVAGGSLGGVLVAAVTAFGDSVLHMHDPTVIEKLDLGSMFYAGVKNGPVAGGVLCGAMFSVLIILLYRNSKKQLD